jgi:hypothetical protein
MINKHKKVKNKKINLKYFLNNIILVFNLRRWFILWTFNKFFDFVLADM